MGSGAGPSVGRGLRALVSLALDTYTHHHHRRVRSVAVPTHLRLPLGCVRGAGRPWAAVVSLALDTYTHHHRRGGDLRWRGRPWGEVVRTGRAWPSWPG